ncbi:hypothetical protein F5887DRAFT_969473 [Amanita rubescens]|nr:hypothetical protein F5887DRAFT_969473 [Amanita rubescens]
MNGRLMELYNGRAGSYPSHVLLYNLTTIVTSSLSLLSPLPHIHHHNPWVKTIIRLFVREVHPQTRVLSRSAQYLIFSIDVYMDGSGLDSSHEPAVPQITDLRKVIVDPWIHDINRPIILFNHSCNVCAIVYLVTSVRFVLCAASKGSYLRGRLVLLFVVRNGRQFREA